MTDAEYVALARDDARQFADDQFAMYGTAWVADLDLGPAVSDWDAFKACVDRHSTATDEEVATFLFQDHDDEGNSYPFPQSYIDAYIATVIAFFRNLRAGLH